MKRILNFDDNKFKQLMDIVSSLDLYSQHSRVHLLKSLGSESTNFFIKRDDELSFSISGCKLRKYLSLIPYLLEKGINEAVVIGSAYSNHVVGFSQLLIEDNIQPTLFLLNPQTNVVKGNLLITKMLVAAQNIHWISREDWPHVELLANTYIEEKMHQPALLIPEGACMQEALPGALTLATDIIQNEIKLKKKFDNIFIDAGTGLTAIAVILAFSWLNKTTQLHIILLADTKEVFLKKLQIFKSHFEKLVADKLCETALFNQFELYTPQTAKAFGSTNTLIFKTITEVARTEGLLLDPIYSAKLFLETKRIVGEKKLIGNNLLIHSGGGLSLMGFQENLVSID